MAVALEKLLAQCPDVTAQEMQGQECSRELEEIDRKIDRLVDALSQSDTVSVGYINSAIRRLKFEPLKFEQKKLVAA